MLDDKSNSSPCQSTISTSQEVMDRSKIIDNIWKFLRRPGDLQEEDEWPCIRIREVTDKLIPTVPNRSKIPIGFAEFLSTGFRVYKTNLERDDHISFFVGTTDIRLYSSYWQEVLLRMLITFCGMQRPRTTSNVLRVMQNHLGGFDCLDEFLEEPKKATQSHLTVSK